MNKHAYLIIAHTDFHQLLQLVKQLDDVRNDIYIHIDRKASFDGVLTGKVGALNFDGILQAVDRVLIGENIDDIYGHL